MSLSRVANPTHVGVCETPLCSEMAADTLNFEHILGILLHEVLLVGVGAVDVLHALAQVILLGVVVHKVRVAGLVARRLPMRVRGEDLRERVPHLQLPVECPVKVSRHRVKGSILDATFGCRGFDIVLVVTGETLLVVGWVSGRGRQFPIVKLCLLSEHLRFSQLLVELLFLDCLLGASHGA